MKRVMVTIMALACVLVFSCATGGTSKDGTSQDAEKPAAGTVNLDAALGDFSAYIAGRLPNTAPTAVAITSTPVQRLGNYIADELTSSLLNNAGLRMVSRQDFERVLSEQNIQTEANFNDDTTAKIGHNLGWRTIIFTAVEPLQESYRLSLRAVDVETGELRGTKNYVLNGSDPTLISIVNPNMTVERLSERETLLQPFDGKRNNFNLTVTANKNVYYDGEELFVTLRSSEDCYFVIYHLDINNNMQIIYPNFWDREKNFLKANTPRTIPEDSSFTLRAPYGEERVMVYASLRQFTIPEDQYNPKPITQDLLSSPQALWRIESGNDGSKALSVTPRGATGQISYTILPGR
ncbi:MAG: DUF4384 domain-containing protein [Treponema sp.]|nr:DUF4384 domain-containing protein [Treponema sp.]